MPPVTQFLGAQSLFARMYSLMVPGGVGSQIGSQARKILGLLMALIGSLPRMSVWWTFGAHQPDDWWTAVESHAMLQ